MTRKAYNLAMAAQVRHDITVEQAGEVMWTYSSPELYELLVIKFHALCEGLAAIELRGQMTSGEEMRIWRDALTALVAGFAVVAQPGGIGATAN